jgi:polyisoprenoid-binding protein YceI
MTAIAAPTAATLSGRWVVDPAHTTLEFRVRHAGLARVRGVFAEFDGVLDVTDNGGAGARASIATASLGTGVAARDAHLRSADFFDAERHPRMTFASTAIDVRPDGGVTVTGELTIRGIAREIVLEGELLGPGHDDEGAERVGLELTGRLDRRDYGLTWNAAVDGGGLLVGNRVDVALAVSAVRS